MKSLKYLLVFATMSLAATNSIWANELDQENSISSVEARALVDKLPQTIVVRVSKENPKDVAVAAVNEKLAADQSSHSSLDAANFTKVVLNQDGKGELENDSSQVSWYRFYYNYPGYYPGYSSYGYGSAYYYAYGYSYNYSPYYYYPAYYNNSLYYYYYYNYSNYSYCGYYRYCY